MLVGLDAVHDQGDPAIGVDQEGGSVDAHVLLPVKAFFLQNPEFLGHRLVFVGHERVGEGVLLLEFLLCRRFVGGDADDRGAGTLDFLKCVAEPARFERSTRSVCLGEEEQDQVLPAIVLG